MKKCPGCGRNYISTINGKCPLCRHIIEHIREHPQGDRTNAGIRRERITKFIDSDDNDVFELEPYKRIKEKGRINSGHMKALFDDNEDNDKGEEITIKSKRESRKEFHGEVLTPINTDVSKKHNILAMSDISHSDLSNKIDRKFIEIFGHHGIDFPPTIFCDTVEEFAKEIINAYSNISNYWKKEGIDRKIQEMKNVLGAYISGVGCFINGATIKDRNHNPIETIAHEKYGHGLIAEITKVGRENIYIDRNLKRIGENFYLLSSDDPKFSILNQKRNAIFPTTHFTEEGFSTWIEGEIGKEFGINGTATISNSSINAILNGSEEYLENSQIDNKDILLVKELLLGKDVEPRPPGIFIQALKALYTFEEKINQQSSDAREGIDFGRPIRYDLGKVFFNQLSDAFGRKMVPHVIKIIGNYSFDIENISLSDLERVIEDTSGKYHMDARMLSMVSLKSSDIKTKEDMNECAREYFNFPIKGGRWSDG